jgi:hypothetical protein
MFLYPNIPYFHHFQHPSKKKILNHLHKHFSEVPRGKIPRKKKWGFQLHLTEYPAFVVSLAIPLRVLCGAGFVGYGHGL